MERLRHVFTLGRLNVWSASLMLCLAVPMISWAAEGQKETAGLVSIPLESLDVQEAVATVSVLDDPQSSVDSLLGICDSEFVRKLQIEGEDIQETIKKLCGMMEGLAKKLEPPAHEIAPSQFLIQVPLKRPHQAIRSVTWKAKSLDDAMTFIELLKDGRLKAVKVFSAIPWSDNPTQPCSECPVKDLVFRLEAMKDQRHLLE
ncbi:hypothetical protein [Candidatus Nitronereus thalassa]|uniref:Uncharacterized protein n=1 Tax=Candidatus Nitronereus thalassa TaxID=3020898 RepID=A0ABU3K7C0_9BACT|nr:hypothetical protein [Candidatus Nitronereus thalassa]MDT7042276.1 hypothetical protein [Candidatus Nitronereus thalassa]